MVPEQKRKHADFVWLGKNMYKLQDKYAGKFIAVVALANEDKDNAPAGGKDAIEAYNKSRKEFPENEPVMDIVPTKDCLLL